MSLRKVLVVRFSALGDVALLVPVIRSLVATYQDVEVTLVTRPKFAPLFYDIERVVVFPADIDYTYTGILGMRDLFRTLIRKGDFEVMVDCHDHLRTIILRTFFTIFGTPVVVFNKGRKEKKAFSRKQNKITAPLRHTVIRYLQAFEKAGFSFKLLDPPYFSLNETLHSVANEWLAKNQLTKTQKWIGIAPFAMHASKIWPLENYATLIEKIIAKESVKFFLFGGGAREIKYFESLRQKFPQHCVIVAGQLKLRQEIVIMQQLDLMVCVDSANMHLASLAGVPVLSLWCGTHPDVGFAPFMAPADSIVQISRDELPCRPCSVYGKDSCYVGGFPCQTRITADLLAEKVLNKVFHQRQPV